APAWFQRGLARLSDAALGVRGGGPRPGRLVHGATGRRLRRGGRPAAGGRRTLAAGPVPAAAAGGDAGPGRAGGGGRCAGAGRIAGLEPGTVPVGERLRAMAGAGGLGAAVR